MIPKHCTNLTQCLVYVKEIFAYGADALDNPLRHSRGQSDIKFTVRFIYASNISHRTRFDMFTDGVLFHLYTVFLY